MNEMKSLTLNNKTYDSFVDRVARSLSVGSAIIGSASGENIPLSDASNYNPLEFHIYGKTTQDGTPTPDAPVELVSAGDGGSIGVTVTTGKNLLDLSNFTDRSVSGVTITNNRNGSVTLVSDGTYDRYYNASVLVSIPSGRYKFLEASSSRAAFVRLFPKGETTYTQYNAGVVFEYDNSTHDMRFLVQYDPGTIANITIWPMICHADETNDTYEPHKGQHLTISTPNGLPGIPVSSGGNYTDANGQQWICDEIDLARGVHIQRIGKWLIDGDIAPTTFVPGNNGGTVLGYLYTDVMNGISTNRMPKMCDKLRSPTTSYISSYKDCEAGFWSFNTTGGTTPDIFLIFNLGEFSTKDEAVSYLQTNPLTFIGILETPIETPLSEEALAAYADLHTYRDNTTVFNDAGAHMELEYVMDAKKYIDSLVKAPPARIDSVTLLASAWVGNASPYSQVVTINGVTENSQVDLTPSVEQLAVFHHKDLAFVTENVDGVVTVYAIGDKPTNDYSIQVTITEVYV